LFICELTYSGVFNIENIQDDYVELMLYIECPRLLFPFARSIISKTTQDGGFPPLFIDPIDFAALYQYNMGKTVTPPKENVTN
jgi:preprotein translocase subunit SecB